MYICCSYLLEMAMLPSGSEEKLRKRNLTFCLVVNVQGSVQASTTNMLNTLTLFLFGQVVVPCVFEMTLMGSCPPCPAINSFPGLMVKFCKV